MDARDALATRRAQALLSPEQYDRLLATLTRPVPTARAVDQERKLSRGVTILVNLGAIVLGAGLLIFVASNWIEFSRPAKIASLFTLTLFFYVAGRSRGAARALPAGADVPGQRDRDDAGSRALWFILLLTLLTSAGIYLGIAWESAVFLNTSLVFFAINIYTRFYEYFCDAMPKSLFFIVGGATLILGGVWVETMRRRIVRRFQAAAA
jgi:uncharacterized membrane protein